MPCVLVNRSDRDMSNLVSLIKEFFPYAKKQMGFDKDVTVVLQSDIENSKNPLGKTAYYDPENSTVVLYVDGRHPKDIMRSLNHELVHHKQNCEGGFEDLGPTEEGYAQSNPRLREMEEDAYKDMSFRDWENGRKQTRHTEGINLIVKDILQECFSTTYK